MMHPSTIHFIVLLFLHTSALALPYRTQPDDVLMEGKAYLDTDPNQLHLQHLSTVTVANTVQISTTLALLASQVTPVMKSTQLIPAPVSNFPIVDDSATIQTAPVFPTLSARAMPPSRTMDSRIFHPSPAPGKPVPGMPSQGQLSWGYASSMMTVTRTVEREAGFVVGYEKSLFPTGKVEAREAGEVVGHGKSLFPTGV